MSSLKKFASECFMAGLKNVPIIGTAAEIVDGVRQRYEIMSMEQRLDGLSQKMTSFETKMRNLVRDEVVQITSNLCNPKLSPQQLSEQLRNLREIQRNGWEPVLFEGILSGSSHYKQLKTNPQQFGTLLLDHEDSNLDKLHVLVDADKMRILELTPRALSSLICNQEQQPKRIELKSGADVWALGEKASARKNQVPQAQKDPSVVNHQHSELIRGKVKKLTEAGYGFIDGEHGDVFFHESDMRDLKFSDLTVGREVRYRAQRTERGMRATTLLPVQQANATRRKKKSPTA